MLYFKIKTWDSKTWKKSEWEFDFSLKVGQLVYKLAWKALRQKIINALRLRLVMWA